MFENRNMHNINSYSDLKSNFVLSNQSERDPAIADRLAGKLIELAKRPLSANIDQDQIKRFFQTLLSLAGEDLIELRILGVGAGLFDDPGLLIDACRIHSGKKAIYFGLNPRASEALSGRPRNTLFRGKGFSQKDVTSFHWLYIDLDPDREPNTSASLTEIEKTAGVFKAIYSYLQAKTIPCMVGLSGNGIHLLVRLTPMEVSDNAKRSIGLVLGYLNRRFGTEDVKVDGTVKDPARICKAYGTLAIKGIHTVERPHRLASMLYPQKPLRPIDLEMEFQDEIREQKAIETPPPLQSFTGGRRIHSPVEGDITTLDIVGLFQKHDLYERPIEGKKHEVKCPWESDHSSSGPGDTIIFEASSGSWAGFFCHHNHCKSRTIKDVIDRFGPKEINAHCHRDFVPSQSKSRPDNDTSKVSGIELRNFLNESPSLHPELLSIEVGAEDGWVEPKPLRKAHDLLPIITCTDMESITPPLLSRWIRDISERVVVGPEFVATAVFGMLGGLVGRRIAVKPKRLDDWAVHPCCLWTVISAPPGSKKSPIFNKVMKVVNGLEDVAAENFKTDMQRAGAKIKILEIRRKEIEKQIAEQVRDGGTGEAFTDQLAKLTEEEQKAKPRQIRYITSDATGAKLIEILADNPVGMTVFNDEIESLFQSFEQKGNEGLRPLFLEAREGTGRKTQDRIGAGTRRANAIALTVLGSTQPDKLARVVTQSEDGLIQRFGLMVSMPESEYSDRDQAPDAEVFGCIGRFGKAISVIGVESPIEVPLSSLARSLFTQWERENHALATHFSTRSSLKAHITKYPSLVCGLSGLFHLVQTFDQTGSLGALGEISEEAMGWAAEWIESVYLPHAKFIYERNSAQTAAEKLTIRIKAGNVTDGITVRALERHGWEGLSNRNLVHGALEELEDLGWLRVEKIQKDRGRPSEIIRINPLVLEGGCHA